MGYLMRGDIYAPLKNISLPICRYKATLTLFLPHWSGASQISCNIMLWMLWTKEAPKMCLTYRLCVTPIHTPPTQHLLPKRFTASAQLCLPKLQASPRAVEKSQHSFPPKIHNISLHTNVFHSNLDRIFKIIHPNSQM